MLNNYQLAACRTFKDHVELTPFQARLIDWSLGIGGEAGEIQELLKHHVFHGAPLDKMEMAKELGDLMWYIAALATTIEIDLQDIADLNIAKLQHRHDQKYSNANSDIRHEKEELFKDSVIYKMLRERICDSVPIRVIFVGPDGAGKTTIAHQVARELEFVYHKCNYEQPNKVDLSAHLLERNENIIFDRFYWPDDIIYTRLHEGLAATEFFGDYTHIIQQLQKGNTLFVMVDADLATLIQRSTQWQDDYIKVEQLSMLQEAYGNLMLELQDRFNIPVLYLNTSDIAVDSEAHASLVDHCISAIKTQCDQYKEDKKC